MKILVILNDLDIGGAQNYTISLINEFVKMGHTVSLCILSNNLLLKDRLSTDINVNVWPRKYKIDFWVIKNIRNEIKNGGFNGIIASYIIYQKLATIFLKNLPITIYPIHSTIERDKKSFILNFITYRFKKKNEVFLTSIDNQTNYLQSVYKLKEKFFDQIYNGVDTNKFTLPPTDFNRRKFLLTKKISPDNIIILMVAGFRKEKRHIAAIEAFKQLTKEIKNVSLVFVGDMRLNECKKLSNIVKEMQIENIHFFTADKVEDIRAFYWSSTFFTLTSDSVETFPIASLEAMSSGLPCVLTNIGGAKNIIDGITNGILVIPNDIQSIKNGFRSLIESIDDFDKNKIRDNIIKNYSLEKSASEYINLIDKAC